MNDMHRKYGYCSCPECAEKRAMVEYLAQITALELGDELLDDMSDASQSNPQIGKISQPARKHTPGQRRRNGGK